MNVYWTKSVWHAKSCGKCNFPKYRREKIMVSRFSSSLFTTVPMRFTIYNLFQIFNLLWKLWDVLNEFLFRNYDFFTTRRVFWCNSLWNPSHPFIFLTNSKHRHTHHTDIHFKPNILPGLKITVSFEKWTAIKMDRQAGGWLDVPSSGMASDTLGRVSVTMLWKTVRERRMVTPEIAVQPGL